jgi:hypothetical protein
LPASARGGRHYARSAAGLPWPDYRGATNRYMTPLYFGEVPIIFWLLIKGARDITPLETAALQMK